MNNFKNSAVVALLVFSLAACSSTKTDRPEGPEGGGEESATQYNPADTYDETRAGARLVLRYDAATQAFVGTVTNTTSAVLTRVRVEVHLSNGMELGPTPPIDLAPGETRNVTLPAVGQTFATWSAHPEVGMGGPEATFGAWADIPDVPLGIEHARHGLKAWYTVDGAGVWTPHLSPSSPQAQPDERGTWTGHWKGSYGSADGSGSARITVDLTPTPTAALSLEDIPALGNLEWQDMAVTDGRFTGNTADSRFKAAGQFGGAEQAGVVGHASGSGLRSVFYGEKSEVGGN